MDFLRIHFKYNSKMKEKWIFIHNIIFSQSILKLNNTLYIENVRPIESDWKLTTFILSTLEMKYERIGWSWKNIMKYKKKTTEMKIFNRVTFPKPPLSCPQLALCLPFSIRRWWMNVFTVCWDIICSYNRRRCDWPRSFIFIETRTYISIMK